MNKKTIIYTSKFKVIWWDEKNKIIGKKWFELTEDMTDNEFQHEMIVYGEWVKKLKPENEFVDTLDFHFSVSVSMQDWVSSEIFKIYDEVGLKKAAFVSSKDLIAQLGLEQAMDENYGQKLVKKYFETEEEAFRWLLKN